MSLVSERVTPIKASDTAVALLRGFFGRCPQCGKGHLLHRYLKVIPNCSSCGEAYGHLPSDDMPPWLTILIVGHLLFPNVWWVERNYDIPLWMEYAMWPTLGLLLTLILLPRCKGFVIALLWTLRIRRAAAEKNA